VSRRKTIDDLVARVIEDALDKGCKLVDRVEALKVVTTYHALTLKHRRHDDGGGGLTWEDIQREVHGAGSLPDAEDRNGTEVRGRPGRRIDGPTGGTHSA
jgi:hypothetical protein